jgi:maleate isomerase
VTRAAQNPIRKIVGVLVPFFNTAVEHELAGLRPPGVSNQTARFALDAEVIRNVVDAARNLAVVKPDVFLIGFTTESFPDGLPLLQQAAEAVRAATGVRVVTASHATHAALRHLSVRRIAVVSPFDGPANDHVRAALEGLGFDVVRIHGLACPSYDQIGWTPLADVRRAFGEADSADAEVLVEVGTGLPTLPLIEELEETLRKPVIACNAASYWQALRVIEVADPIRGFGRLLAEARTPAPPQQDLVPKEMP